MSFALYPHAFSSLSVPSTVPRAKSSAGSRKHVKSRTFKTIHLLQLHPQCSEGLR